MKKLLGILLICFSILSVKGEQNATETDITGWNCNAKLFSENVKVGKSAVCSGIIKGNYPSFSLDFTPADMSSETAEISFFLRVNTDAAEWLPEIRLSDKTNDGFMHWHPDTPLHKGNMGWQEIAVKVNEMKRYKTVDLNKISKITFVGYRVAAPKGKTYTSEFFIDGLTFKNIWAGPVLIKPQRPYAFRRMSGAKQVKVELENNTDKNLDNGKIEVVVAGKQKTLKIAMKPGEKNTVCFDFDTALRQGAYPCELKVIDGNGKTLASRTVELYIAPRPVPHKMPVIMWGHGDLHKVQERGFTHCFVTLMDSKKVDNDKKVTDADYPYNYQQKAQVLDQALIDGFSVVAFMGIGRYLNQQDQFLRIGRDGKVLEGHKNICAMFPEVLQYGYNAGASVARTYGQFPAFDFAMVETENRDGTKLCFHQHDKSGYKKYSGKNIPDNATGKMGVNYRHVSNFSANRIIKDDNPTLEYLKWFWQQGDGWNNLYTQIHKGLQSGERHINTWYDPAVRVPSISGSGGEVDFVSQWTYTYPDPIKIGKVVDELAAMSLLSPRKDQKVMNTTQIIWYRSATAPKRKPGEKSNIPLSDWEKRSPDANYITIAPDHLSEAFWSEISRNISGIMYHGWWSLGDYYPNNRWKYRYTNSRTKDVLKQLIDTVVTPLGPSLLQIPEMPSDIAFLQSFSSEMFAQVGEFGWGWGWANDAYQILRYAHLQPKIVYEESIQKGALDGVKILVAVKCPVLTKSVAEKILDFQKNGGIIIGDENLAPGITPDIILKSCSRTKSPHENKAVLQAKAKELMSELRTVYSPYADCSNPDVILRTRRYGNCDYLFVINDKRTYGNYVGQFGKVMEKGLPLKATVKLNRKDKVYVYDLVKHQLVKTQTLNGRLNMPVQLEAGAGKLFMISKQPVQNVALDVPQKVERNNKLPITVRIIDHAGKAVNGIIPLELSIIDSKGEKVEFSGYYGVKNGEMEVILDIAGNDRPGAWQVIAKELASNKSASKEFTVY